MRNLEREADKKQRLIRDGKKVLVDPENTVLVLRIFQGFTVDERDLTKPYNGPQYYRVMAWTDEEDQYGTQVVKSFEGFHCFKQKLEIPLDSPADQYLYVELLRGFSYRDPGTSNGTIVMGRAKIKLPPWTSHNVFNSKANLVGLNSDRCVVYKGYLEVSMKLLRY